MTGEARPVVQHRIGVIGYGVWGTHALQGMLAEHEGVRIAAVHADDRWGAAAHEDVVAAARAYAQEQGAVYHDDWRAVLDDPKIDIISAMTCPSTKAEVILAALERGKHVITDKPLALDAEQTQAIVAAEAGSAGLGLVLCGHHYGAAAQALRPVVDGGELGALKHIDVSLYFGGGVYPGFRPTRRYRRQVPGGELTVIGCHALQTLLGLSRREPLTVFARTGQRFYDSYAEVGYEDWAEGLLRLTGGVSAGFCVARLPHKLASPPPLAELTFSHGHAVLREGGVDIWPGPRHETFTETLAQRYHELTGAFLRAAERGEPSPIGFAELHTVQRVLDAAYASAATGAPVRLAETICA